ncbi:MAG: hypothetical protein JRG90_19780, partial [Deltaproteobacteria bacterium]|nr:hypothetical protein [Deltaproteobacteria bacterium]
MLLIASVRCICRSKRRSALAAAFPTDWLVIMVDGRVRLDELLGDFLPLADETDPKAVVRFSRRWGALHYIGAGDDSRGRDPIAEYTTTAALFRSFLLAESALRERKTADAEDFGRVRRLAGIWLGGVDAFWGSGQNQNCFTYRRISSRSRSGIFARDTSQMKELSLERFCTH